MRSRRTRSITFQAVQHGTSLKEFLAKRVLEFREKHLFPLAAANNPPEMQILVGAYVQRGYTYIRFLRFNAETCISSCSNRGWRSFCHKPY